MSSHTTKSDLAAAIASGDNGRYGYDMVEAYAFMRWIEENYPHELLEFAEEYAAARRRT
jgi:hypothetical protein